MVPQVTKKGYIAEAKDLEPNVDCTMVMRKAMGYPPAADFPRQRPHTRLADAEDLLEFRKAKRAEGKRKSISLPQAKRELGFR